VRVECIDSSYVKSIYGRDCIGHNPTDRGRNATNVSAIVASDGVPVALAFFPGNTSDQRTVEVTLRARLAPRAAPQRGECRCTRTRATIAQPIGHSCGGTGTWTASLRVGKGVAAKAVVGGSSAASSTHTAATALAAESKAASGVNPTHTAATALAADVTRATTGTIAPPLRPPLPRASRPRQVETHRRTRRRHVQRRVPQKDICTGAGDVYGPTIGRHQLCLLRSQHGISVGQAEAENDTKNVSSERVGNNLEKRQCHTIALGLLAHAALPKHREYRENRYQC